jgi:hypothetical protein
MGHRASGVPDDHDEDGPHPAGGALGLPQEVRLGVDLMKFVIGQNIFGQNFVVDRVYDIFIQALKLNIVWKSNYIIYVLFVTLRDAKTYL